MSTANFRPMSTGEILDVAFGLYRKHFSTLITVSVLLMGIPLLVFGAIAAFTVVASPSNLGAMFVVLMGFLLGYMVLAQLSLGASILVVSQGYLGRDLSAGAAIKQTLGRLGLLLFSAILVGLVTGLGSMLILIPGIILFCGLSLTTPVVMLESPGNSTDAMGRSWTLTKGYRWRMFLVILVGVVLTLVMVFGVNLVLGLAFGGFRQPAPGTQPNIALLLVQQGIQLVANMIVAPLPHCILAIAYYDLRIRKEAFDLEMLASTLQPA